MIVRPPHLGGCRMRGWQVAEEAIRQGLKPEDYAYYECRSCQRGIVVRFDWRDLPLKRLGWKFLPPGDEMANAHCPRCLSLMRRRPAKKRRRRL